MDIINIINSESILRAQELLGGHPGLPIPNKY